MGISEEVAKILLEIDAVAINTKEQFTLVSGKKSPIYIDCRKLISYPEKMDLVADFAKDIIEKIGAENVEVLAGGETAGIPFATWLSAKTKIPMIYVRKKPKGYGKVAQIEGVLKKGQKILLVEDLITSGKSKLSFVNGIRNAGAIVENCLVVFDREQSGTEELAEQNVTLHRMTTLSKTLDYGLENNFISEEDFKVVKEYLRSG